MSPTIYSVAKKIKDIALTNKLIKEVYIDDISYIYELVSAKYPLIFISYDSSNYNGTYIDITYQIIIADLQIQGDTNLFQLYSDTSEIAYQLLSDIDRELFDYNIISNNITPFKDYNNDNYAGSVLNITIQIPKPYNNC